MSEPKRDRYGRYLIAPYGGGEPVAHTRVTTVAKVLDDRDALEKWQQRNVALGLAARPDLFALASATPADDKRTLNKVCKDAIEASSASARANLGTALHTFTERVDRGEDFTVPPTWRADVDAYTAELSRHGITVDPKFIECIAVCDVLSEPVAGTFDRVLTWRGENFIGDLKTGTTLDWSWRAIAMQLAFYSRARSIYDPQTGEHTPMPKVNQSNGIILHLPAGEGVCTAWWVDLSSGWEAAQKALWVRGWRKRKDVAAKVPA